MPAETLNPALPGIQEIQSLTTTEMAAVNDLIRERLSSEVALINQISEHIIAAGGKRLRPMLAAIAARALGHSGNEPTQLAAIIEFIHTATLLHDDVVDESNLRRGRKTANAIWGNAPSVLVGDFLYSRAFQMMVTGESMRVMQIMADATNKIAEGEVLQLLNINDPDVTVDRYTQVIEFKTAKLFEAAAQVAAVLAGADTATEQALAQFGRKLGSAFQLIDDVLDYEGDAALTGKNVGDDLREGKVTMPLIHVATVGSNAQKALVREAIEAGGTDQFAAIFAAINATGALAATRALAAQQANAASAALTILPDSEAKKLLLYLCELAVDRDR